MTPKEPPAFGPGPTTNELLDEFELFMKIFMIAWVSVLVGLIVIIWRLRP